jgi:hypothetical protein
MEGGGNKCCEEKGDVTDLPSKKTKPKKGERVKRLVLLSLAALMLVATVFAPAAMAQEPGEIDVQSVTLGPGGSVTVTGTIECVEGYHYQGGVDVTQLTGKVYNYTFVSADGGSVKRCETTGPKAFTATAFSQRPFHKGEVTIRQRGYWCLPDLSSCEYVEGPSEVIRIR